MTGEKSITKLQAAGCRLQDRLRPEACSLQLNHRLRRRRRGQATLETTVAIILGMMLLLATAAICFWFSERLIRRQLAFEQTRGEAGRQRAIDAVDGEPIWTDPVETDGKRLRLLVPDGRP